MQTTSDMPLSTRQVAERLGITPGAWRARVHREQAPPADGRFDERTPYWMASTIDAYASGTDGRAEPSDRPMARD